MSISFSISWRRRITGAVWILGLCLAVTAIARRPSAQIPALAWAEPVILAAPEDGILLQLHTALHDSVMEGEVLAQLDPRLLAARGDVLEAELKALHEEHSSSAQGRARRFEGDRETASLEIARLLGRIGEGEALLRTLGERFLVAERLVAEGISGSEKAADVRREIEVSEARVDADRRRLELARRVAERAGTRAAGVAGPNRWEIEAAERRLSELAVRVGRLTLRSSTRGQIAEVFHSPGEWVGEGEAVLRISPAATHEVHAWMDTRTPPTVGVGASARIRRATGAGLIGTVIGVGAERLRLPKELWARSKAPQWGYRIRILVSDGDLGPGEPVQVSLVPAVL